MSSTLFPIVSLAIRLLLANRLQKAVDLLEKGSVLVQMTPITEENCLTESMSSVLRKKFDWSSIPLKCVSSGTKPCYVSAIALQLANQWRQPAMDWAEQIAYHLSASIEATRVVKQKSNLDNIWQHFGVRVDAPGWISLQLSESGLATWLQLLVDASSQASHQTVAVNTEKIPCPARDSTRTFLILYTHARCCSLLRLAAREKIIGLTLPDPQPAETPQEIMADWFIRYPDPFPWLNASNTLYCQHPLESRLIAQIQTILDDLSSLAPSDSANSSLMNRYLKHAYTLSQDFQNFYAACRIWGEVKIHDANLAQARLGLVAITQAVLRSLLEQGLGIPAPMEL